MKGTSEQPDEIHIGQGPEGSQCSIELEHATLPAHGDVCQPGTSLNLIL